MTVLYMKTDTHFIICRLIPKMEIFQTKVVEKIILYTQLLFRRSCRLGDSVEKYCTTGQDGDDNTAHAQCMLVT